MGIFNYFCRKENKIEKEETKMSKNVIVAEGYADDLYEISHNGEMKQTRLFYLLPDNLEENQETLDLVITSTNPSKSTCTNLSISIPNSFFIVLNNS